MQTPSEICELCKCFPKDAEVHHCSPDQQADEQRRRHHAMEADFLKDGFWLHFPLIDNKSIGK